jgi:TonB family protein
MLRLLAFGVFACLFTSPLAAQDVYRISDRVSAPTPLTALKPDYTSTVMKRRIDGKRIDGYVELELDVLPDGTVGTVALVTSLDPDLDAEAAQTAKRWKFTPGMMNGKPVAVRTVVRLQY